MVHIGGISQFRTDHDYRRIGAEADTGSGGMIGKSDNSLIGVFFRQFFRNAVIGGLILLKPRKSLNHERSFFHIRINNIEVPDSRSRKIPVDPGNIHLAFRIRHDKIIPLVIDVSGKL